MIHFIRFVADRLSCFVTKSSFSFHPNEHLHFILTRFYTKIDLMIKQAMVTYLIYYIQCTFWKHQLNLSARVNLPQHDAILDISREVLSCYPLKRICLIMIQLCRMSNFIHKYICIFSFNIRTKRECSALMPLHIYTYILYWIFSTVIARICLWCARRMRSNILTTSTVVVVAVWARAHSNGKWPNIYFTHKAVFVRRMEICKCWILFAPLAVKGI